MNMMFGGNFLRCGELVDADWSAKATVQEALFGMDLRAKNGFESKKQS
jgi:hypothetical protein